LQLARPDCDSLAVDMQRFALPLFHRRHVALWRYTRPYSRWRSMPTPAESSTGCPCGVFK
jgi:hypothetical protein